MWIYVIKSKFYVKKLLFFPEVSILPQKQLWVQKLWFCERHNLQQTSESFTTVMCCSTKKTAEFRSKSCNFVSFLILWQKDTIWFEKVATLENVLTKTNFLQQSYDFTNLAFFVVFLTTQMCEFMV